MEVTLGHWLADNTPPGATIGCDDVGAIGYFSNRRIFDLHGLVTRQTLSYKQDPEGTMAFLTAWKPTYLAIFPAVHPELKDAPFLQVVTYAEATCGEITFSVLTMQMRRVP